MEVAGPLGTPLGSDFMSTRRSRDIKYDWVILAASFAAEIARLSRSCMIEKGASGVAGVKVVNFTLLE